MTYLQSLLEVFIPAIVGAVCSWLYFAGRQDQTEVKHNADLCEQAARLNALKQQELALQRKVFLASATNGAISQFALGKLAGLREGRLEVLSKLNEAAAQGYTHLVLAFETEVAPPEVHLPPPYLRG